MSRDELFHQGAFNTPYRAKRYAAFSSTQTQTLVPYRYKQYNNIDQIQFIKEYNEELYERTQKLMMTHKNET